MSRNAGDLNEFIQWVRAWLLFRNVTLAPNGFFARISSACLRTQEYFTPVRHGKEITDSMHVFTPVWHVG